jgi:hypothetical protein
MTTGDDVQALFEAWQGVREEYRNAAYEIMHASSTGPEPRPTALDREEIRHLGCLQQAEEEAHESWWDALMALHQA